MPKQPMDADDRRLLVAVIDSTEETPNWHVVAHKVGKTADAVLYVALFSLLVAEALYPSLPCSFILSHPDHEYLTTSVTFTPSPYLIPSSNTLFSHIRHAHAHFNPSSLSLLFHRDVSH